MVILKKYKTIFVIIASLLVFLYASFLLLIPNIININNYKKEIQKLVTETTNLNLDFNEIKIVTTPNLHIGLRAQDVTLAYLDGNNILDVKKAEAKLAILPLILKTIKITDITVDEISLNLKLLKDGQLDIIEFINNNFPSTEQTETNSTAQELPIKISEKLPKVIVNDYKLVLIDTQNNNNLAIDGKNFTLDKAILNKHFRILSKGSVLINNKQNINYDCQIFSFWPTITANANNNQKNTIQLPAINFLTEIVKYDPTADIITNMKIAEKQGKVYLNGFLNIDKLSIILNNKKLPDSYFHLVSKENKTNISSNFWVNQEEKAEFLADIVTGNKTKLEISLLTDKISFSSIQNFAIALLDSLNIKNDLSTVKILGYIKANFHLKTDLKKFASNGQFQIIEGAISHKLLPVTINKINSNIDLNNNNLNIQKAEAFINNTQLFAKGYIDSKSNTDITVKSDNINIAPLFNAFAPKDIKNTIYLNSGILNIDMAIKGKLSKIEPILDIALSQFVLNTKAPIPTLRVSIPNAVLAINPKDVIIDPFKILINSSFIDVSGGITNYLSKLNIDIQANGSIKTTDINNLLPKEIKNYMYANGELPIKTLITGDLNKININTQILGNANNHFSPISIKKIINNKSLLNIDVSYTNDNLSINDVSLYIAPNSVITNDTTANKKDATKIVNLSGLISKISSSKPNLKLVLSIPSEIFITNTKLPINLTTQGNINIYGDITNPLYKGSIFIKNVELSSFLTKIQNINLQFNENNLEANIQNLDINGTTMNIVANASTKLSNVFLINSLKLTSPLINADNLFVAMEKISKEMPQTNNTQQQTTKTSAPILPIKINNGSADIEQFTMKQIGGNLVATKILGNFTLNNDLLKIPNFKATVYNGTVDGAVSYNIKTTEINANVKGTNIEANPAVTVFVALKDQIIGNIAFNADVKLKGATYEEQMKSLNGDIHFELKDGQMGSLGRLETFLKADNLLSQNFISTKIGQLISTIAPYNTGKFSYLNGDVKIVNGTANLNNVKMSGPHMSLLIKGAVNILTMNSNLQILGSLSQEVTSALGPVANLSIEKLTAYIPVLGTKISTVMHQYNESANKTTLATIPNLTPQTTNTKSFKVVLNGNLNTPPSTVKKFHWLNTPEIIKAEQSALTEAIAPKKITKEEIKEQVKQDVTNVIQNNETVQKLKENKTVKTLGDLYKFYKGTTPQTAE